MSIFTLVQFVLVPQSRVRLFPYELYQTYLAEGVGVGKQQKQIGGNVWMVICVCVCVCETIPWGSLSAHTDSVPSPAVPPDPHILTVAFLRSGAWRQPCSAPAPIAKHKRGSGGISLLCETNRPSKQNMTPWTWMQNCPKGCAHIFFVQYCVLIQILQFWDLNSQCLLFLL